MEEENDWRDPEIRRYNKKHKRIRGTMELKYPPRESRCRKSCGHLHYVIQTTRGDHVLEHPCFLALGHIEECQFSSECTLETSPVEAVGTVAA